MKHILLSALIALAALSFSANAQSKINGYGNMLISNYYEDRVSQIMPKSLDAPAPIVGALVTIEGDSFDFITEMGFEVVSTIGDIAVVQIPLDRVEDLAARDEVRSISLSAERQPALIFARPASKVNEAHNGILIDGETTSFTGKGVVTGIFDGGLDPNHINFTDADGNCRVSRVFHFTGSNGTFNTYRGEDVATFTTDDENSFHGSHVLGILCGSYKGNVSRKDVAAASTTTVKTYSGANPYYGVATESDIAFGCGALFDSNIATGTEEVIKYAESVGKPAVVNLSLGSNIGTHSPHAALNRILATLGRRAIITISSGNEGDRNLSVSKTLGAGETSFTTFIGNDIVYGGIGLSSYYGTAGAEIGIYSNDSDPFTVSFGVYNVSTGEIEYFHNSTAGSKYTYSTSNTAFKNFTSTTGRTYSWGGVDSDSKFYNVALQVYNITPKSGYYLALTVNGKPGARYLAVIKGYSPFTNYGLDGFLDGSADDSINDMACADNIIAVGSYTTRQRWGVKSGQSQTNGFTVNAISPFSSYGPRYKYDGTPEQLPHVLAPGATLIASWNRYFVTKNNYANNTTANATVDGSTHYWGYGHGTSMAAPYMAGVIALWLEADPTLDVDDVKNIINNTSITDSQTEKAPLRAGAGKVDAAAGLRFIKQRASIGSIYGDDDQRFILTPISGGYNVVVEGESALTASIHTTAGTLVNTIAASGNTIDIPTDNLAAGIYILTVDAPASHYSRKIVVR